MSASRAHPISAKPAISSAIAFIRQSNMAPRRPYVH
jgi:hypothetical protein